MVAEEHNGSTFFALLFRRNEIHPQKLARAKRAHDLVAECLANPLPHNATRRRFADYVKGKLKMVSPSKPNKDYI